MVEDKKNDIVWNNSQFKKETHDISSSKKKNANNLKEHAFNLKSKRRRSTFKPVIIASFSAIAIGAILGLLLLSTFIHLPNKQESVQTVQSDNQSKNDSDESTIDKDSYTLPSLKGYVLQGGMFSQEKNAEEWQTIFAESGVSTYIWEEHDSFYLFAGLFANEHKAKEDAIKAKEAGLDIFTKIWEAKEQDVTLTEEENEWVLLMVSQWEASLQSLNEEKNFQISDWEKLIADKPLNMPYIQVLVEFIENTLAEDISETNEEGKQIILLSIWHEYKKLLTND